MSKKSNVEIDLENSDLQTAEMPIPEGFAAAAEAETVEAAGQPNIIFIGEGDPPLSIHGAFKADLPDQETQKRGFHHESAGMIIRTFPKLYKRFQKLGDI